MGSAGKTVKSIVAPVANAVTLGMSDSFMGGKGKIPTASAPKPVAPSTSSSENAQQAKDNARRNASNRTGRSQSSILNPAEALADEEKDILG